MQKLKINELFISLQGEGARTGEVSGFIRLQGCSAKFACARQGVVCDTEFESGAEMELEEVVQWFKERNSKLEWLIFTGGEPLDQLTPEIVGWFKEKGYKQAVETSGVRPFPFNLRHLFDYITCSPKVAEHVLAKNFEVKDNPGPDWEPIVDELRYVRHAGQPGIPEPSLTAQHYYLSPHSDGATINQENLRHCIGLCLENPKWKLSVQQHKVWNVL